MVVGGFAAVAVPIASSLQPSHMKENFSEKPTANMPNKTDNNNDDYAAIAPIVHTPRSQLHKEMKAICNKLAQDFAI